MTRTASAAAKHNLMLILLALAAAPVTFGNAVAGALAVSHVISWWWLAVTLGWAAIPLAVFARSVRYARQSQAARLSGGLAAGAGPR